MHAAQPYFHTSIKTGEGRGSCYKSYYTFKEQQWSLSAARGSCRTLLSNLGGWSLYPACEMSSSLTPTCSTQRACGQRTENSRATEATAQYIYSFYAWKHGVPTHVHQYSQLAAARQSTGTRRSTAVLNASFLLKRSAAKPAALNSEPAGSDRHSLLAASLRGAQLHTVVSGWALGEHTPSFPTKGPFPLPRRVLSLPCKHLLPLLPFKIKLWESHTYNFRSVSVVSEHTLEASASTSGTLTFGKEF